MGNNNLGKYKLLSSLGSGASAEVYHARNTALGRDALKVLKPASEPNHSSELDY